MLLWPVGLAYRLWIRSVRFENILCEETESVVPRDQACILFLWHNRLFLAGEWQRRFRGVRNCYGLISASKDGALLETFYGDTVVASGGESTALTLFGLDPSTTSNTSVSYKRALFLFASNTVTSVNNDTVVPLYYNNSVWNHTRYKTDFTLVMLTFMKLKKYCRFGRYMETKQIR